MREIGCVSADRSLQGLLDGKRVEWLDGAGAAPRIVGRRFADAEIAELSVPPMRLRQAEASRSGNYHLVLMREGYGRYRTGRREFVQEPGDIVLLDSARICEMTSPRATRLLRWTLPRHVLAPLLPRSGRRAAELLAVPHGPDRILARHMCDLTSAAETVAPDVRQGLLAHMCGLVGLAVGVARRNGAKARDHHRAMLRQRILTYIETHLRDPSLAPRRAAAELGISPRWLHALLADVSISFSDHVARRRLDVSASLLADPELERVSITEIAFGTGFNDLSTFYRRFRARYGMTPKDMRALRAGVVCGR